MKKILILILLFCLTGCQESNKEIHHMGLNETYELDDFTFEITSYEHDEEGFTREVYEDFSDTYSEAVFKTTFYLEVTSLVDDNTLECDGALALWVTLFTNRTYDIRVTNEDYPDLSCTLNENESTIYNLEVNFLDKEINDCILRFYLKNNKYLSINLKDFNYNN